MCYPTTRGYGMLLEFEQQNLFPGMRRVKNFPFRRSGTLRSNLSQPLNLLSGLVIVEIFADDMPGKRKWLRLQDLFTSEQEDTTKPWGPIKMQSGIPEMD